MIFVFVSAHVIRTLFLVTAHEFHETKIWFFVSVFRVLKGVASPPANRLTDYDT